MADGPRVVIAAGGTGGHIYPGLALAAALRQRSAGAVISFVGTPHGMEGKLIPDAGYDLDLYRMRQFNAQGWRKILVPGSLARASLTARKVLRVRHADAAVTMGGYVGVPLAVGSRLARVPCLVYEPGAAAGQANRLATRFTHHVATAFAGTRFRRRTARHIGYTLQPEYLDFDRDALRPEARRAMGIDPSTCLVLVHGGSSGALTLNRLALGLAERWAGRLDVRILLKAGARTHGEIAAELADNPGKRLVDLVTYIERLDHAYAAADIAICRAGAGTVSELAAVGLPSILVPLPHVEHDEQTHNAEALVTSGGALLVRDADATAATVGPLIEERLDDPAMLAAMRKSARSAARPDAAGELADWLLELARS